MKQIPITVFPFGLLLIAGRGIGGPELQHGNELLCLDHVMARSFSSSEALPSFVLEFNIPSKMLCSRQTTCPHCCSSQGLHSDQKFCPGYTQIRNSVLFFSSQENIAGLGLPGTGYKYCTYVCMYGYRKACATVTAAALTTALLASFLP